MNIAFVADNDKKELLVQFCHAYCGLLGKHRICATSTTGKQITEATGLKITDLLPGEQGGVEQISALVSCDQIDMLIYFRSGDPHKSADPAATNLLRLCDMHMVPAATNLATAEMLIHGLNAGWLDWRDIAHPK